jgi:DMSO/TMAO reductase YedYZ molybdopterin-dependent catalytic subunit
MSRSFCYYIALALLSFISVSCGDKKEVKVPADTREMVTYPEKAAMYLLTDRPPQLETPLRIFRQDITPNEYFFVRWHLAQILTKIDIDTFKLYVNGNVDKPLALSMNDLRTKFTPDSVIALTICAGNSRSTFNPRVPGGQWCNGGMGNAKWKGVKLKDILAMAGVKSDAMEISFQGMDRGALPGVPDFVKSLDLAHAMDGEVLVAYEMNGKPIPMLNGYPLKLVVPGWYATYWIGSLSNINVLKEKFTGYWMEKAYQVPANKDMTESHDSLAKNTAPISKINLHSIFVEPDADEPVTANKQCLIEGLAFNDGTGIQKVELSLDNGATWIETRLDPEIGKYSWRRWRYDWTPNKSGQYHLCVRATDKNGHTQNNAQWNRSGYARGFIEHLDLNVN